MTTKNCQTCRYWSELCAEATGGSELRAICLVQSGGQHSGDYTRATTTCDSWASGHLGPIDEPGKDPDRYDDYDAERHLDALDDAANAA